MALVKKFEYGYASLCLSLWEDGTATVSNLQSREPGNGHATALMRDVVNYANTHGLTLVLYVESYGNMDNDALVKFYEKFGFEIIEGYFMRRK